MIQIRVSDSIGDIDATNWNHLVGEGSPFLEYNWLYGLEKTGCVTPEEGWMPQYLTAWQDDSSSELDEPPRDRIAEGARLVGAIPLYLKGHSRGEFVYDWSWANLASQLGEPYYPKLIAAVPFTPVTGQRILVDARLDQASRDRVFSALIDAALAWAQQTEACGLHFLFLPKWQADLMATRGLLIRTAYQYKWTNPGYADFDDFISRFRSRRRNKIKRERRELAQSDITLEVAQGEEITLEHITHVRRFYKDTCRKFGHWTSQYLKDAFFEHIREHFTHRTQLILARDKRGHPVAGTFSLLKNEVLYGRYWGCDEDIPFLHFNACYYAPIERAIELGVTLYEPGQGGHHKYRRGFEPQQTWSAHWLASPRMRDVLAHHLVQERAAVAQEVQEMVKQSPLKSLDEWQPRGLTP